jgi:3-hydroxy-9,10-secoandrosta-1,3,5(10)-triene-9,17-dione monooxygenase reductase component
LMKKFARGVPDGADPFEGVNIVRTAQGAPYLTDALAYLECKLLNRIETGGDHELCVAEVIDGHPLREGTSFTHLRGNGFHY